METGALLKSFIYIIASSLLYPVLLLLVLLTIWIVIYSGAFFVEWLSRARKKESAPEKLPSLFHEGNVAGVVSHRVQAYVVRLRSLKKSGGGLSEIETENLLQEVSLKIVSSLDRIKMVIRIGPSLGLIGTLIPMGTGLAALGRGDMTKLSSDLVIAFTTTVVGLAIGVTAYFYYTVKRRWIEEDIKNIELATEIIKDSAITEPARSESISRSQTF